MSYQKSPEMSMVFNKGYTTKLLGDQILFIVYYQNEAKMKSKSIKLNISAILLTILAIVNIISIILVAIYYSSNISPMAIFYRLRSIVLVGLLLSSAYFIYKRKLIAIRLIFSYLVLAILPRVIDIFLSQYFELFTIFNLINYLVVISIFIYLVYLSENNKYH